MRELGEAGAELLQIDAGQIPRDSVEGNDRRRNQPKPQVFCTCADRSRGASTGSTIASLGSGSEVQIILLEPSFTLPAAIIVLRLRSKSVAMSTCSALTAISFAAWVAPSLYFQKARGSIFHTSLA